MARFVHGHVLSVDHTPTVTAVTAGEVVTVGEVPYVSHQDIPLNEIGAVAATGGTYEDLTDGTVAAGGVRVNWDSGASRFTTNAVSGTVKSFGFSLPDQGAAAADTLIRVVHCPLLG